MVPVQGFHEAASVSLAEWPSHRPPRACGVPDNKEKHVPHWLDTGSTAWQMTAATFVGLMSVPGLVVLYGGVMQKRWSINSMMLTFGTFAVVMIIWVLYAFKMGFGNPWFNSGAHPAKDGFLHGFIGTPGPVLSAKALTMQAVSCRAGTGTR